MHNNMHALAIPVHATCSPGVEFALGLAADPRVLLLADGTTLAPELTTLKLSCLRSGEPAHVHTNMNACQ